jgi:hypothetical protein
VVAAIWVLLSMGSLKVLNNASMTGNFNPNIRGQAVPAAKSGEGGLLPGATKSGEGVTPEAVPTDEKTGAAPAAEAPGATSPPAAPAGTKSDASTPPAESAKAADAAKP